jgi:hypothetical protein
MEDIKIEDYTDKSFVVRGDTRKYLEQMKNFGGKWNSRLTDKSSGEKFGAWIFPSMKKSEVQKWIQNKEDIVSFSSNEESPVKTIVSKSRTSNVTLESIYNMLICINERLEVIESKVGISKDSQKLKKEVKQTSELVSEDWQIEDDIVPTKPMKRLLATN